MLYSASNHTITDSELTHTTADVGKQFLFYDADGVSYYSSIASYVSQSSVVLAVGDRLPLVDTTIFDAELVGAAIATITGGIISLEQAKILLRIEASDTSQDALLSTLISDIGEEVRGYCNNDFTTDISHVSETTAFTISAITDASTAFTDFIAGDYLIRGSKYNDGIVNISTVTDNSLATSGTLTTEALGNEITIKRVVWPKEIRPRVAVLLKYHMALSGKLENSTSVPGSQGGSGAQYKSYAEIMAGFNQWKKPAGARFVR